MESKKTSLSIVIPCHNEEEVLNETYCVLKRLLDSLMAKLIGNYEIVLVNNGSTDSSLECMLALQNNDESIVVVDLRRNFGFQGSITAGIEHAKMDVAITIDADLQDDPGKIEEMIEKYHDGYEMVLGVRKNRESDSFLKRKSSMLYYKLIGLLGIKLVPNHGDYRLLSRNLINDLGKYKEVNRYLRGMIFEIESKFACVYYDRKPRSAGLSKFDIKNLFSLGWDGITSFSSAPIRLVFIFGFFVFFLSIIGTIFILYERLIHGVSVPGWAFTVVVIMFFGGLQSLFLGLVGEYIAKSYIENKKRPVYLVRKIYRKI